MTDSLLDLFISFEPNICFKIAFPPFGNSDRVVVSVSIYFRSISEDAAFHRTAYDCSCADWDGLCDHLKDVLWDDNFKV